MTLTTIIVYGLLAITVACALEGLASMFGGKTARTIQSAGLTLVVTAASSIMIQTTVTSARGIDGIGWLVELSGDTRLAMFVIGGALVVFGSLISVIAPVRMHMGYKSSTSIIGTQAQRLDRRLLKQQLRSFGKRRSPDHQRLFAKND